MSSNQWFGVCLFLSLGIALSVGTAPPAHAATDRVTITIATGPVGGLYHPFGGAICKLVNERRREHGITCTVSITGGTVENIRDLRRGDVDLVLSQSDWQHDAVKGEGPFTADGPFDDLRSVFAVYVEHFTVVARPDAEITQFEHLKGKRVFLGEPGSGHRQTMRVLLDAYGWAPAELTDFSEFQADSLSEALCDNEFDAYVYTIGHPNPTVQESISTCNAVLVEVTGQIVDELVAANPFYVSSFVPANLYQGMERDKKGFGLVASLLTRKDVEDDVIFEITGAFVENLDRLRDASSAFRTIRPGDMKRRGLTAPLHDGAIRYFDAARLN